MAQSETPNVNSFNFIKGENVRLMAGESVPVNPEDDDFLHFRDHGEIIFDKVKFNNMQPKARKAVIKHIMAHLKNIDPTEDRPTNPDSISDAAPSFETESF